MTEPRDPIEIPPPRGVSPLQALVAAASWFFVRCRRCGASVSLLNGSKCAECRGVRGRRPKQMLLLKEGK